MLLQDFMSPMFDWLLEQLGVAIVLGIALYVTYKERRENEKKRDEERVSHQEQLEKLHEQHKADMNSLHTELRQKEIDNLDTLKDVSKILGDVDKGQDSIQTQISELKELLISKFP